jgi:hypothetical protein
MVDIIAHCTNCRWALDIEDNETLRCTVEPRPFFLGAAATELIYPPIPECDCPCSLWEPRTFKDEIIPPEVLP